MNIPDTDSGATVITLGLLLLLFLILLLRIECNKAEVEKAIKEEEKIEKMQTHKLIGADGG